VSLTTSGPGGEDTETQTNVIHVDAGVETERFVTCITGTTGESLVYGSYVYMSTKLSYIGIYNKKESHNTFWFAGVDIPQGAQIVGAWIRLPASQDLSSTCTARIVGFDQNYASPVLRFADWEIRPRTDATVLWNMGVWLKGGWYSTPEIASIVQEIIDRTGWRAGRSLAFSIGPEPGTTGYRALYQRDQDYFSGAELTIDYLP